MIECPNCGGNLKFDIRAQQMVCAYCNEQFDPYAFDGKTKDAEEQELYDATVFTCPQCGGEILSTDDAAAGFCSFCGASTILYSRIEKEKRPGYIIPFTKTKEDCKKAYTDLLRRAIFAPKKLRDRKHIDSFRGIYMPYWVYDISQEGEIELGGKKEYRRGDYIIKEHYALTGEIDASYNGISYDASSSFADSISEKIAPYDVKNMAEFTPAFLSGFYADVPDVRASVYQEEAKDRAVKASLDRIKAVPEFKKYQIEKKAGLTLNTKTDRIENVMFPVWFLSYRNKDRVAYATINGQTGKAVADLPIDPKRYLLGSLLLAVPIFLLMNPFLTLRPSIALLVAGIVALFTMILYLAEYSKIERKENGLDDKGLMSKRRGRQQAKGKVGFGFLYCVAAMIADGVIIGVHPVSDLYYYGGVIFTLIAVFCTIICIMNTYNILTTRKLPQFDRQGGDDRA